MARWVIGSRDADTRLDAAIASHLQVSVAEARRAIAEGLVRVDDRRAKKGARVALGATVEVSAELRAGARSFDHAPVADPSLTLEVVFEDDALIAVNKPAGVASHPLRASEHGTVAHALLARCPACATASIDAREAGLVHRLDRGTTGVLLAAKRREVWDKLRAAFGGGEIDKTYWALVEGVVDAPIVIDAPLRTVAGTARVDQTSGRGLAAVTQVRAIQRGGGLCLVQATARTGRMHQVRAHLAHIGHPLVGDRRYGASTIEGVPPDEALLHARAVSLSHPVDDWRVTISAALPRERRALIERLLEAPLRAPA